MSALGQKQTSGSTSGMSALPPRPDIWPDPRKAEAAYGAKHAEVEALFTQWRQDDTHPVGSVQSQLPVKGASNFVPLTPALLRRLADAHFLNVSYAHLLRGATADFFAEGLRPRSADRSFGAA